MAENFNQNYGRYYDLLYRDKNYEAEADYVSGLIRSASPGAKEILELGSGTGKHAALLCRKGMQVTGIERSAAMAEISNRKKVNGFRAVVGDISDFQLNQKFDAAISLFHVISYLNSNQQLVSCFKLVNQHLNADGLFIFDTWYSPAVYIQKPETRIKRIEDGKVKVIRLAEPVVHYNENVVEVNFEIIVQNKETGATETFREKHPMRHFSIPEIDLLARLTGFELLKAEEFLTGASADENTWGVCFVLKKKA